MIQCVGKSSMNVLTQFNRFNAAWSSGKSFCISEKPTAPPALVLFPSIIIGFFLPGLLHICIGLHLFPIPEEVGPWEQEWFVIKLISMSGCSCIGVCLLFAIIAALRKRRAWFWLSIGLALGALAFMFLISGNDFVLFTRDVGI